MKTRYSKTNLEEIRNVVAMKAREQSILPKELKSIEMSVARPT